MAVAPVTDSGAVAQAIAEFDLLGRDAFLDKYRFGAARRYFLIANGRRYDSKAILGAAYGYQYGRPLAHEEFSGGDAGAARALRRLGFMVVADPQGHHTPAAQLQLWQRYTRPDAHAIFSPDTRFTPNAGTWGLQGIVPIPEREGDFVFFVTFGMSQGSHDFDESISDDGVLTWQSQPRQHLQSPQIKTFIQHDERVNSIHLFLRSRSGIPYTYFGPIGYLSHDLDQERPVHFQWQLLEWPPPPGVLESTGLREIPASEAAQPSARATDELVQEPAPTVQRRGGRTSSGFRSQRQATHVDRDAQNAELGLAGELLVLAHEISRLKEGGRPDLAGTVTHVSVVEGDTAGYDIRSYDLDGNPRFLEVKTTRGAATAAFFVSANQVSFSRANPSHFHLVRVHGYDPTTNSARFFEVPGSLEDGFELAPTEYRASVAGAPEV